MAISGVSTKELEISGQVSFTQDDSRNVIKDGFAQFVDNQSGVQFRVGSFLVQSKRVTPALHRNIHYHCTEAGALSLYLSRSLAMGSAIVVGWTAVLETSAWGSAVSSFCRALRSVSVVWTGLQQSTSHAGSTSTCILPSDATTDDTLRVQCQ